MVWFTVQFEPIGPSAPQISVVRPGCSVRPDGYLAGVHRRLCLCRTHASEVTAPSANPGVRRRLGSAAASSEHASFMIPRQPDPVPGKASPPAAAQAIANQLICNLLGRLARHPRTRGATPKKPTPRCVATPGRDQFVALDRIRALKTDGRTCTVQFRHSRQRSYRTYTRSRRTSRSSKADPCRRHCPYRR